MKSFILSCFLFCFILNNVKTCSEPYSSCNTGKDDMLNIHLVPHTHNDVGWLRTVDQYYYGSNKKVVQAGVQYILDTVIDELAKDSNRRFVYVEMAYFWRWWNEQNDETKQLVRNLVAEGRLEFVIGGWCMNDEATAYYQDIIDQQTLGLQFILNEFGECARPKVAWQLDPFGHSREQASLFAQFGFDGLFLGRLDYQDNDYRSQTKTREFVWKSSNNLGETVDLFTGVFEDLYQAPLGFCFDTHCYDDPIMDNPDLEDYNVDKKVNYFVAFVKEKQKVYRSNHLLLTMGSDFEYTNAHMWYKNLDKLIKYVNKIQNETHVNAFYSTPSCYLYSLYKSNLTWPNKVDDFFPYANKAHSFWTGYYTSRTTLKKYVRSVNSYYQAARQLISIAYLNTPSVQQALFSLDEAMSIVQHHDGVSGTEQEHVAKDYAKRLAKGTENVRNLISQAYYSILSRDRPISWLPEQQYCPNLNISECLPIENKNTFTVIIYNPVARQHESWIRIPVSSSGYIVKDAYSDTIVESEVSQIFDDIKEIPERVSTTSYEILFRVELPPLGFKVFNVTKAQESKTISQNFQTSSNFQIENQHLQLNFNTYGELIQITALDTAKGPLITNLNQTYCYYDSFVGVNPLPNQQSSGIYAFRPKHQHPVCFNVSTYSIRQTPLVQEVHQVYNEWISQTIRLYNDSTDIEFEWQVGPIPVDLLTGKEVIIKFSSDIQSNKTFYTDANGREIQKRVRDYRSSWNFTQTEPVAGNYYPINSRIFINDLTNRQLTLLTDRSLGGSSIDDGSIEIMLHRRILMDDTFGEWEPLNELGANLKGLIARGKQFLIFNTTQDSARHHRNKAHKINTAPLITFVNETNVNTADLFKDLTIFNLYQQSLPQNVELLTLVPDFTYSDSLIIRFEHFYELNEDSVLSQPASFDIRDLFNSTITIVDLEELALGANMNVNELENRLKWRYYGKDAVETDTDIFKSNNKDSKFTINLQPMQIRTFRAWYIPN